MPTVPYVFPLEAILPTGRFDINSIGDILPAAAARLQQPTEPLFARDRHGIWHDEIAELTDASIGRSGPAMYFYID